MVIGPLYFDVLWGKYAEPWVIFIFSLNKKSKKVKSKHIILKLFGFKIILTVFLYGICLDIIKERR